MVEYVRFDPKIIVIAQVLTKLFRKNDFIAGNLGKWPPFWIFGLTE